MFAGTCVLFVAVFGIEFANGGVAKKDNYIPLKYPGPVQEVSGSRYGDDEDVPQACRNQNFCAIKPPDYPQERLNQMFKGTDPLDQPALIIETVVDRQGNPDEMDDCDSVVSFEPLYTVRNQRGEWRKIVQAPEENYVQMVRLETCKNAGKSCFSGLSSAPAIKTMCTQKYSTWEFLVVTGENETAREKLDIPTCCSCKYVKS